MSSAHSKCSVKRFIDLNSSFLITVPLIWLNKQIIDFKKDLRLTFYRLRTDGRQCEQERIEGDVMGTTGEIRNARFL